MDDLKQEDMAKLITKVNSAAKTPIIYNQREEENSRKRDIQTAY